LEGILAREDIAPFVDAPTGYRPSNPASLTVAIFMLRCVALPKVPRNGRTDGHLGLRRREGMAEKIQLGRDRKTKETAMRRTVFSRSVVPPGGRTIEPVVETRVLLA
jgi:hypothetical protein